MLTYIFLVGMVEAGYFKKNVMFFATPPLVQRGWIQIYLHTFSHFSILFWEGRSVDRAKQFDWSLHSQPGPPPNPQLKCTKNILTERGYLSLIVVLWETECCLSIITFVDPFAFSLKWCSLIRKCRGRPPNIWYCNSHWDWKYWLPLSQVNSG